MPASVQAQLGLVTAARLHDASGETIYDAVRRDAFAVLVAVERSVPPLEPLGRVLTGQVLPAGCVAGSFCPRKDGGRADDGGAASGSRKPPRRVRTHGKRGENRTCCISKGETTKSD
ncbi:hypothetical protein Y1Q_0015851 [Alligator mississippiensis]|uniref:Uncharacterized protein n=1 Tax=Alligator mississippiensis TaxID=8496 RepID=A0A151MH61_ALLMI|nr:hypothetical protein Y1Q_0015851 [Alligator mississippiensis]